MNLEATMCVPWFQRSEFSAWASKMYTVFSPFKATAVLAQHHMMSCFGVLYAEAPRSPIILGTYSLNF